jgi:hypothetical protein
MRGGFLFRRSANALRLFGRSRILITVKGRGRPPTIDALAIVAALNAGEGPYVLARRLGVPASSIYRARDRARRVVAGLKTGPEDRDQSQALIRYH